MEYPIIKMIIYVWASIKWWIFGAFGSGLSIMINKSEENTSQKFMLFASGAMISVIGGEAIIEIFSISGKASAGLIYWSLGVWGMGIIIELNKQLPKIFDLFPEMVKNIVEKFTK